VKVRIPPDLVFTVLLSRFGDLFGSRRDEAGRKLPCDSPGRHGLTVRASPRERHWRSSAGLRLYVPISVCVFLWLFPLPHYVSDDGNDVFATRWRSTPTNLRDLSPLRGRTCIQLAENEDRGPLPRSERSSGAGYSNPERAGQHVSAAPPPGLRHPDARGSRQIALLLVFTVPREA